MNDKRARDQDRDQAIEVVEAAWADGQIIEADRDKRVESLLQAQTLAETQMLVHDLQRPKTPPPPAEYGAAGAQVDQLQAVKLPKARSQTSGATIGCILVPMVFLVVFGGIAFAIFMGLRSNQVLDPGEKPGAGQVNVISVDGLSDLVDALVEETGSSEVFSAVLYPTYAIVDVPVDATSQRDMSFYWDGDLEEWGSTSTSTEGRFDLADIDGDVVAELVKNAQGRVDGPDTWYASITLPSEGEDDAWIWAYATNEYSETAYVAGTLDGTLVREYDSP